MMLYLFLTDVRMYPTISNAKITNRRKPIKLILHLEDIIITTKNNRST